MGYLIFHLLQKQLGKNTLNVLYAVTNLMLFFTSSLTLLVI